jgi:hypothetical protein
MNKPTWGGRRTGAGRSPLNPSGRKRKVSITLDPDVVAWLTTQRQRDNEPISNVIERLLQERKRQP